MKGSDSGKPLEYDRTTTTTATTKFVAGNIAVRLQWRDGAIATGTVDLKDQHGCDVGINLLRDGRDLAEALRLAQDEIDRVSSTSTLPKPA